MSSTMEFLLFPPLLSMMQPHMVGRYLCWLVHDYTDTYALGGKTIFFSKQYDLVFFLCFFHCDNQPEEQMFGVGFGSVADTSPARHQTLSILEGLFVLVQFKCCAGTSGSCKESDAALVVGS